MRALLVQFDIAWEDRRENLRRVRAILDAEPPAPSDLIVLPEMFDSGFSLNVERTADDTGETRAFVSALAQERGSYVYAGFTFRRDDGMGLNRAIIVGPAGETLCTYDKLHPFSFGREQERFAAGQRGVVTCSCADDDGMTLCPAVCYDLRFPELFRVGLDHGAEVFVIGANWPSERAGHWRALLIARAIENQAYVVGVNRVGADPQLTYAGGSMVVSPRGEVLAEGDRLEGLIMAPLDREVVREWRETFPAWRDRRPDLLTGD